MVTGGHAGGGPAGCWRVLAGPGGHTKRGGKPFTCMQEGASCQRDAPWLWTGDSTFWRTTLGRCSHLYPNPPGCKCVRLCLWTEVPGEGCVCLWTYGNGLPGLDGNLITGHTLFDFYQSHLLLTCQSPKIPFDLV